MMTQLETEIFRCLAYESLTLRALQRKIRVNGVLVPSTALIEVLGVMITRQVVVEQNGFYSWR